MSLLIFFVSAKYQKLKNSGDLDMPLGKVSLIDAPYVIIIYCYITVSANSTEHLSVQLLVYNIVVRFIK